MGDGVAVRRQGDTPFDRSLHGLTRALLANMVMGVTKGFERTLLRRLFPGELSYLEMRAL